MCRHSLCKMVFCAFIGCTTVMCRHSLCTLVLCADIHCVRWCFVHLSATLLLCADLHCVHWCYVQTFIVYTGVMCRHSLCTLVFCIDIRCVHWLLCATAVWGWNLARSGLRVCFEFCPQEHLHWSSCPPTINKRTKILPCASGRVRSLISQGGGTSKNKNRGSFFVWLGKASTHAPFQMVNTNTSHTLRGLGSAVLAATDHSLVSVTS